MALARNRLFTSVQLLPGLLLDPFGFGGGRWPVAPHSIPIRSERSA